MTLTVSSLNDMTATNDKAWAYGVDASIASDAFDFTFDSDGSLISYWVTINETTGVKEKFFTAKGEAAFKANADRAESYKSMGSSSLVGDYAISEYTTWK